MLRRFYNTDSRGYGAILAAVLLFLVCMVGLALLGSYALNTGVRTTETGALTKDVYQAIVGNPEIGAFGYLGDSGGYPANLNLLLIPGTNGPLLRDVPMDNNGVLLDGFNGPLEYWRSIGAVFAPSTHGLLIISRGADHVSSNSSLTPNLATSFIGTTPVVSGYPTTPDNLDNMVVPDIFVSRSAMNLGYTGTITYNFRNYDVGSSQFLGACPAAYTMEMVSDTRGPTMERILGVLGWSGTNFLTTTPTTTTLTMQLVQGLYTMRLAANSSLGQTVYTESVSINPGVATTRNITLNAVNTSNTPTFSMRIRNQTGATMTVRQLIPTPAADILTIGNSAFGTATVNACGVFQARSAAGGGGTAFETWLMTNANMTKVITNSATNAFTATVTANPSAMVQFGNPTVAMGNVYRLRQGTFSIPGGDRVEVLGVNGTILGSFPGISTSPNFTNNNY